MTLTSLPPQPPLPPGLLDEIATIVGPAGMITEAQDLISFISEQRGNYHGNTPVAVRPASTAEVSAVVRLCASATVPMVPQGGNTGLAGATVTNGEIVLNLGRMDQVRAVDPANFSITVEAGCILANVQQIAETADRLFPLSLGAEGTCQIGGNLSTNAGGHSVLRYGNARDLTLGLEVVLADGQVWDGLRSLRKDNTGYDLKHLFTTLPSLVEIRFCFVHPGTLRKAVPFLLLRCQCQVILFPFGVFPVQVISFSLGNFPAGVSHSVASAYGTLARETPRQP